MKKKIVGRLYSQTKKQSNKQTLLLISILEGKKYSDLAIKILDYWEINSKFHMKFKWI